MTSVLPATAPPRPTDLRHRRPLVLAAALAGAAAAAGTLVVCLALGVAGWYLADAGAHGAPRDGLQVGALAWLMAHGTGVRVQGVAVTVIPLGLTLACAWTAWRLGHRLGDSVSGHGPDADRLADGERDWTVPVAVVVFGGAYATVVAATAALAASPQATPSSIRGVVGAAALTVCFGGPGIAIGSGRLPVWAATLPDQLTAGVASLRRIVRLHLGVGAAVLLVALALDWAAAANVMSQLHTDAAGGTSFTIASAALLPNAAVFACTYLLGPGFAVGAGTLVSPTAVVLGPLPLFPLLAALPDAGPTAGWTAALLGLPPLVAAAGAALGQRAHPTTRWDHGALRGCAAGVGAGVLLAVLAALAGGAVGPGRMQQVGPDASAVLVHAVAALGVGGLLGGLAMTWWQRRQAPTSTRG